MITDLTQLPTGSERDRAEREKRKRTTVQYVSRHFSLPRTEANDNVGKGRKKQKVIGGEKEIRKQKLVPTKKPVARPAPGEKADNARPREQSERPTRNLNGKMAMRSPGKKQHRSSGDMSEAGTVREPSKKLSLAPWQQILAAPADKRRDTLSKLLSGTGIDELSSDSELTDVPDDIGPDPFNGELNVKPQAPKQGHRQGKHPRGNLSKVVAVKEERRVPKVQTKANGLAKSPYFPHPHKPRPTFLSTLPFPPIHLERFGLMQERLCHDPFRLLLATIFLNKTPGSRAMPIFFKLMEQYPTPTDLSKAEQSDVTAIIHELGFQNQRARKCIAMAQKWVEDPPRKGRRCRKVDYPNKGDGKDIKADEHIDDQDARVAWEISHLPGLGPYSHDSWRMFCRDELRGLASAYNGEDAVKDGHSPFEPEWKRVLPADKELRAWMTWMWMKEGWVWNKETGERAKASEELMELARGNGNIVLESEASTLQVKSLEEKDKPSPPKLSRSLDDVTVEVPAGTFMSDPAAQSKNKSRSTTRSDR